MNFDDITLVNNEAIHHFELIIERQLAFIDYKLKEHKIYLIHTEVPEALKGTGAAEAIVKGISFHRRASAKISAPVFLYTGLF